MKIRKIIIEDYDEIIGLWLRAGLEYKPAGRDSKEAMRKQIEKQGFLMLAAEENDRIVGVAVGSHDNRKGWINRVAVDPVQRRKGIATDLVKALEKEFATLGLPVYCSLIFDTNPESIALFESLGYKCLDNVKYYSKRTRDDM
ncbi:MAG: GNAT family N-acetyltransferase [bacterium]